MNEAEYPLGVMMGFVLQDCLTPLVVASQNGYLEIVKSLIEAGANVNHTAKVVKIHHYLVHVLVHTWVQFSSINDFCSSCAWIVMSHLHYRLNIQI